MWVAVVLAQVNPPWSRARPHRGPDRQVRVLRRVAGVPVPAGGGGPDPGHLRGHLPQPRRPPALEAGAAGLPPPGGRPLLQLLAGGQEQSQVQLGLHPGGPDQRRGARLAPQPPAGRGHALLQSSPVPLRHRAPQRDHRQPGLHRDRGVAGLLLPGLRDHAHHGPASPGLRHPRAGGPARPLRRWPLRHLLDRGQHDPPSGHRGDVPGHGRRRPPLERHPETRRWIAAGGARGPAGTPVGTADRARWPTGPGPAWSHRPGARSGSVQHPNRREAGTAPHPLQRAAAGPQGRGRQHLHPRAARGPRARGRRRPGGRGPTRTGATSSRPG